MRRYTIAFAVALALSACARATGKEQSLADNTIPIRLTRIQDVAYAEPVTATGTLTTHDELELSFKVGGVVARVAVQAGTTVRKGQTLALLDLREIDAQLAKARTALAKADRDLARARNLYKDSVATLEQLQDATSAAEVARSDYSAVAFNQRYATIIAPADGVILRKSAEPGEVVSAGTTVLVLGSMASGSVVRVGVPDRDAVRLKLGDAAEVTFSALPNQRFTGRVSEIPAAASAATGTYAVEVRLDAPPSIASGLVGTVTVQPTAQGSMRFIPVESVTEADGDRGYVYVVDGTTAKRIPVVIASIDENRVAISAGLDGVQSIVSAGAAYLSDGAKVKVVQ